MIYAEIREGGQVADGGGEHGDLISIQHDAIEHVKVANGLRNDRYLVVCNLKAKQAQHAVDVGGEAGKVVVGELQIC